MLETPGFDWGEEIKYSYKRKQPPVTADSPKKKNADKIAPPRKKKKNVGKIAPPREASTAGYDSEEEEWQNCFAALKKHHEKHKTWTFDKSSEENDDLADWANSQKGLRARGTITKKHHDQLLEIGFFKPLVPKPGPSAEQVAAALAAATAAAKAAQAEWPAKYAELKAFKKKFGHCTMLSLFKENIYLWKWCCDQIRAFQAGRLQVQWKKKLDEVGFDWPKKEMTAAENPPKKGKNEASLHPANEAEKKAASKK